MMALPPISSSFPAQVQRQSGSSHKRARTQEFYTDRFIPNHPAMEKADSFATFGISAPQTSYQQELTSAAFPYYDPKTLLYSASGLYQPVRPPKPVWKMPEGPKIKLDAGKRLDDFYLNPLDWGARGILYGLDSELMSYEPKEKLKRTIAKIPGQIFSVKESPEFRRGAIGDNKRSAYVFDLKTGRKINGYLFYGIRSPGVYCLNWRNGNELTTGLTGRVNHLDLRVNKNVWTVETEVEKTCSIDWNASRQYVATGNNANHVRIYDVRRLDSPVHHFTHRAAVKALRWNPVNTSILMTGGGSIDKRLSVFDINKERSVSVKDTLAQICDLTWLDSEHAIVGSGIGDPENITLWRFMQSTQSLEKIKGIRTLPGRILSIAKDPNGNDFCTLSSAEELCFWHPERVQQVRPKVGPSSLLSMPSLR